MMIDETGRPTYYEGVAAVVDWAVETEAALNAQAQAEQERISQAIRKQGLEENTAKWEACKHQVDERVWDYIGIDYQSIILQIPGLNPIYVYCWPETRPNSYTFYPARVLYSLHSDEESHWEDSLTRMIVKAIADNEPVVQGDTTERIVLGYQDHPDHIIDKELRIRHLTILSREWVDAARTAVYDETYEKGVWDTLTWISGESDQEPKIEPMGDEPAVQSTEIEIPF